MDRKLDVSRRAGMRRTGLVVELLAFLGRNKKWWLVPVVLALVVVGALVILASSPAAPFIYPLF